jgi:hypothetical protein
MFTIYNQGIVQLIANALGITFDEGLFVRAYVNTNTNNLRIVSGHIVFYDDYITIEVTKIINKVLNREI